MKNKSISRALLSAAFLFSFSCLVGGIAPVAEAAFTAELHDNDVVFSGDGASDVTTLRLQDGLLAHDRFTNGDADFAADTDLDTTLPGIQSRSVESLTTITLDGGAGDDIFIADFSAGDIIPSGGISFDGGDDYDVFELRGGLIPVYGYEVGPGLGDGIIHIAGKQIRYFNFEPIIDTVSSATLTINGTDGGNLITLDDGVNPSDGRLRVSIDAFETIEFANKTNVIINGGLSNADVSDTIIIDNNEVATGLSSLTVNGGAGSDIFYVHNTRTGVNTLINGDDGDDFLNFGNPAGTLDDFFGSLTVNGGTGNDQLNINDNGDNTDNTYSVTNTLFSRTGIPNMNHSSIEDFGIAAGTGNDNLNASSVNAFPIFMNGGDGDDTIIGGSLNDFLLGGNNNDTLTGGPGADFVDGNTNDDLLIWNNGDGSDTMNGGANNDTVQINGSSVSGDIFIVSDASGNIGFQRTNLTPFTLNIGTIEALEVNGLGGDDTITVNDLAGVSGLSAINLNGGDDNDTIDGSLNTIPMNINGGSGDDILNGGSDDDTIDGLDGMDQLIGRGGNDLLSGGPDDDLLIWNNGDGSDTMDGDGGNDSVQVNGSDGSGDTFTIDNSSGRVDFQRTNLGLFTLDIGTTETLEVNGLDGDDTMIVNDVSGTALINLTLNGGDGDDNLDGTANPLGTLFNGGVGADLIQGGPGPDTILGGDDDDSLFGNGGDDTMSGEGGDDSLDGGANDDLMIWNNGDGSDIMDGNTGTDNVQVNGSPSSGDTFFIANNSGRVDFQRTNLGLFTLDIGTTETLEVNGLDGDDTLNVQDLTGILNLSTVHFLGGTGNDTLNVDGSTGNDSLSVFGDPTVTSILGGPTNVSADSDTELLNIDQGDGDDTLFSDFSPNTTFVFDGSTHSSGDLFDFDAEFTSFSTSGNTYFPSGGQSVTFNNYETTNVINEDSGSPSGGDDEVITHSGGGGGGGSSRISANCERPVFSDIIPAQNSIVIPGSPFAFAVSNAVEGTLSVAVNGNTQQSNIQSTGEGSFSVSGNLPASSSGTVQITLHAASAQKCERSFAYTVNVTGDGSVFIPTEQKECPDCTKLWDEVMGLEEEIAAIESNLDLLRGIVEATAAQMEADFETLEGLQNVLQEADCDTDIPYDQITVGPGQAKGKLFGLTFFCKSESAVENLTAGLDTYWKNNTPPSADAEEWEKMLQEFITANLDLLDVEAILNERVAEKNEKLADLFNCLWQIFSFPDPTQCPLSETPPVTTGPLTPGQDGDYGNGNEDIPEGTGADDCPDCRKIWQEIEVKENQLIQLADEIFQLQKEVENAPVALQEKIETTAITSVAEAAGCTVLTEKPQMSQNPKGVVIEYGGFFIVCSSEQSVENFISQMFAALGGLLSGVEELSNEFYKEFEQKLLQLEQKQDEYNQLERELYDLYEKYNECLWELFWHIPECPAENAGGDIPEDTGTLDTPTAPEKVPCPDCQERWDEVMKLENDVADLEAEIADVQDELNDLFDELDTNDQFDQDLAAAIENAGCDTDQAFDDIAVTSGQATGKIYGQTFHCKNEAAIENLISELDTFWKDHERPSNDAAVWDDIFNVMDALEDLEEELNELLAIKNEALEDLFECLWQLIVLDCEWPDGAQDHNPPPMDGSNDGGANGNGDEGTENEDGVGGAPPSNCPDCEEVWNKIAEKEQQLETLAEQILELQEDIASAPSDIQEILEELSIQEVATQLGCQVLDQKPDISNNPKGVVIEYLGRYLYCDSEAKVEEMTMKLLSLTLSGDILNRIADISESLYKEFEEMMRELEEKQDQYNQLERELYDLNEQYLDCVTRLIMMPECPALFGGVLEELNIFFSDIIGHWAEDYIMAIARRGIVNGYAGTTLYGPDDPVTRGQLIKVALNSFGIPIPDFIDISSFLDVDILDWFAPYVETALGLNIISGLADGNFWPHAFITRAEALKILTLAGEFDLSGVGAMSVFPDVDIDDWFSIYVSWGVQNNIINGYADGTFGPNNSMTRAELAKIVVLMLNVQLK